jgi:indole-3-glycerol phosphate synthase
MSSSETPKGVRSAGGILDRIVLAKAARLDKLKRERPLAQLGKAHSRTSPFGLTQQLSQRGRTNVVAEIKHRSPSKGVIRAEFDPAAIADSYQAAGSAGLSVLTEEDFFGGSLDHLGLVRKRVTLPLLRKDFIFDEYQLYESSEAGADAVLLIVAVLEDALLSSLIILSQHLGIDALVEVHNEPELDRALRADARLIGVNNRDLTTFKVDLNTSMKLASLVPDNITLISESGINSGDQIVHLKKLGYSGFLIGEHLMRSVDPGESLRNLLSQVQAATA